MELLRNWRIVLAASAILTSAGSLAHAQTVSNGPYYATPSWDQTLPPNTRFIVLSNMNSAAVLDRETGLVWQKTPDQSHTLRLSEAQQTCFEFESVRYGWRYQPCLNS